MTLDKAQLTRMLRAMILIREFDERAIQLRLAGKIYGAVHPYVGQEAVAVGVCAQLSTTDRVTSTHRGHGHCIAKGASVNRMFAELFGRVDGYCKGKGGSMHIADFAVGMLGANGIVAAGLPIACGAALAGQLEGKGAVTVCFFGDGAAAEGEFHESLNIASLWKLPIVFVCENNQYAANNPVGAQHPRLDIATHAAPYDMPGVVVDGNDVLAVHAATEDAVTRARRGGGPSLLECKTYRWHFHAMRATRPPETRPADEIAAWKVADPIGRLEQHMISRAMVAPDELRVVREQVRAELDEAITFAEASPFPDPKDLLADMFAPGTDGRHGSVGAPRAPVGSGAVSGPPCRHISFQTALDEAVAEEMRRDPRVITLGTDFTGDPIKEFGASRVRFSPISEAVLTGMGLGAAGCGVRPIVNWRMVTFSFVAMDQVVNQASKIRYMFGGQADFPVTYRCTTGGGIGLAAQHSQSPYSMWMHLAGLKIVLPSTPADAKGLLKSAIRDDNPVVSFECSRLATLTGPVPDGDHLVPIGVAEVKRPGRDVTIVALAYYVHEALAVADELAREGISVEVVDPRTLVPLDVETLRESVQKTGHLVIVDEAPATCSAAAEIAALIVEDRDTFRALKAPVRRVCAMPVPVPYSPPLERAALPSRDDIKAAVYDVLKED